VGGLIARSFAGIDDQFSGRRRPDSGHRLRDPLQAAGRVGAAYPRRGRVARPARPMASVLGKPIQSDHMTSSLAHLSYARVLVEIDLREDL